MKEYFTPLKLIKTVLYLIAGIGVLVFNESIMADEATHVGLLVGAVVLLYALDIIVLGIEKRTLFEEEGGLFTALTNLLLAIILFIVTKDIISVCLVWAVWSILREGKELTECFIRLRHGRPALVSAIESVVVIIFSFTMILTPGEHHAHVHVILLGIELILEVVFPICNHYLDKLMDERRAKRGE